MKGCKEILEKIECIRCGVCCIMAPCCIDGASNEGGICSYLTIYKEGYTSCKYIKESGNPFPGGCFLRRSDEIYKYHREEAEKIAGIKLVGIKAEQSNGQAIS